MRFQEGISLYVGMPNKYLQAEFPSDYFLCTLENVLKAFQQHSAMLFGHNLFLTKKNHNTFSWLLTWHAIICMLV